MDDNGSVAVEPAQPIFIGVDDAARVLGISRSLAYDMANRWIATAGDDGLPAVRLGRRILINRVALDRWAMGSGRYPSE